MKALDHALAAVIPTAWGLVGVEVGPRGVRQLRLPQPTERDAWDALGGPPLGSRVRPEALGDLAGRLRAYFRGEPTAFADVVGLDGVTVFQRAVYTAARDIPFGQVIAYGDLAARAGHPRAARAVGQALAHNPACLIIP
ncbi:MAG: methylated-DNA--[protein]-cysteine S-methyltransferase [Dehalococcoidia bacterium]|nr:methylated-DNA--[protein]-cysteine S-methyltransferase [Dehalococcoidia bacterium]